MRRHYRGGGWIRRDLRIAIQVIRDGGVCGYCRRSAVEREVDLTLDHLEGDYGDPGYNHPSNLTTCCWDCNHGRGIMGLTDWIGVLTDSLGPDGWPVDIGWVRDELARRRSAKITRAMRQRGKELLAEPEPWLVEMWRNNAAHFHPANRRDLDRQRWVPCRVEITEVELAAIPF